ncbi:helix-turn-helix domain-containing protein [Paenibacillus sp. CAU 1782]
MSIVNERNIAHIRAVYRLSCAEFGALMGVSGRFVSYIERGEKNLPRDRAEQLVRELSLTPSKLERLFTHYEETKLGQKGTRNEKS